MGGDVVRPAVALLGLALLCGPGCGGSAEGGGGGATAADGASSSGAEAPPDPYAQIRGKLAGQWRERLPDEEARVLELMRMAVEHPDWRRRDIQRQELSQEDEVNLESFLNIMRIDPEAKDRMKAAVQNAGMRARFTDDAVFLGRDEMQDVDVPYQIVGVEGDTVEVVFEGAEGEEPTKITFIDESTFEAPWGGGGEVLTFDKSD